MNPKNFFYICFFCKLYLQRIILFIWFPSWIDYWDPWTFQSWNPQDLHCTNSQFVQYWINYHCSSINIPCWSGLMVHHGVERWPGWGYRNITVDTIALMLRHFVPLLIFVSYNQYHSSNRSQPGSNMLKHKHGHPKEVWNQYFCVSKKIKMEQEGRMAELEGEFVWTMGCY